MSNKEELLSFIRSSKRRKEVLKLLSKKSLTATDIEEITGMYKSHVSRTIKELSDKKLVYCKNPKDRVFRYYQATPLGKKINLIT